MFQPITQILIGTLFVATLMSLLWLVQRRTKNAGIVDVAWAGSIGVQGLFFAVTSRKAPKRTNMKTVLAAMPSGVPKSPAPEKT